MTRFFYHFDTDVSQNNGWREMLIAKLKQQAEINMVIATEDEFEMEYHLEHCPECQQGGLAGAISLLSLIGCNLDHCYLTVEGCDDQSVCIDNFNLGTLTEDGRREFADVLNASVTRIEGYGSGARIRLSGCSFEQAKRLADILCQNCNIEDYYRFVAPKPGEQRPKLRTVTQHELEIACAEHTLWRLEHPRGKQSVFEGCDLYQLNMDRKDFNGAVFRNCRIRDCSAVDAEFCSASFNQSRIERCDFSGATMECCDMTEARIFSTDMRDVRMDASNLSKATFNIVNVDDVSMRNCCLAGFKSVDTYMEYADTDGSVSSLDAWDGDCGHAIRM